MNVEVQILDERVVGWGFPLYGSEHAAGLDLFACLDQAICLKPQSPAQLIPTGLAIYIGDPSWCGLVLPRSGLGHTVGLVLGNAIGLIDPDYSGPCFISVWNRNNPQSSAERAGSEITIHPGDRIAQIVFTRVVRPNYRIVNGFEHEGRRSAAGFGSTGGAQALAAVSK